jgi:hypothetical protein
MNSKGVLVGIIIGVIFGAIAGAVLGRFHGAAGDWIFAMAWVGIIVGLAFLGIVEALVEHFVGNIREIRWKHWLVMPVGAIYTVIMVSVVKATTTEGAQAVLIGAILGAFLWSILGGILAVFYCKSSE